MSCQGWSWWRRRATSSPSCQPKARVSRLSWSGLSSSLLSIHLVSSSNQAASHLVLLSLSPSCRLALPPSAAPGVWDRSSGVKGARGEGVRGEKARRRRGVGRGGVEPLPLTPIPRATRSYSHTPLTFDVPVCDTARRWLTGLSSLTSSWRASAP